MSTTLDTTRRDAVVEQRLPAALVEPGTGTVTRPDTVRRYVAGADLRTTVLPIEHDLWRFYRHDPLTPAPRPGDATPA